MCTFHFNMLPIVLSSIVLLLLVFSVRYYCPLSTTLSTFAHLCEIYRKVININKIIAYAIQSTCFVVFSIPYFLYVNKLLHSFITALVVSSFCSYPFSIIFSQSAIIASCICCLCFRKCKKPESKEIYCYVPISEYYFE